MPRPGMRWRHVVISTYSSWLPGDPRGFRSKNHKIHSSGDYRSKPPPDEHKGLYLHAKKISGQPVIIPRECRVVVGTVILEKLRKLNYLVLTVSVAGMHTHIQVELPDDRALIRRILGQCKSASSHAIRSRLPQRVWARDGSFTPIDSRDHQEKVHGYILSQENAWIWSFEQGFPASLGTSVASPEVDGEEHPESS